MKLWALVLAVVAVMVVTLVAVLLALPMRLVPIPLYSRALRESVVAAAAAASAALRAAGVPHALGYGNALAAARFGTVAVMPWDDDVDFLINDGDASRAAAALSAAGLAPVGKSFGYQTSGCVDFLRMRLDGNRRVNIITPHEYILDGELEGANFVRFGNVELPVFADNVGYTARLFGADWETAALVRVWSKRDVGSRYCAAFRRFYAQWAF